MRRISSELLFIPVTQATQLSEEDQPPLWPMPLQNRIVKNISDFAARDARDRLNTA